MALRIVRRNPLPVIRTERALQRIRSDQSGAVYAVTPRILRRSSK